MARTKQATRQVIIDAAELVLKRRGAHGTSLDAVAKAAGCAKGLLNYHFQTKQRLLAEVVAKISGSREAAWSQAFDTDDPHDAIDRTWDVISNEAKSGTLRAWSSLVTLSDTAVDQAVKDSFERFRRQITAASQELLRRAGLESTVPVDQLGWLLASVVEGMSFHLAAGADPEVLENAYAAAWLGILSLTTPAT